MSETKEELYRRIAELEEQLNDLQQQLNEKAAVLKGSTEPGWLIITKNPSYNGVVNGIMFENGRAFLPASNPIAKRLLICFVSDLHYEARQITAQEYQEQRQPVEKKEPSFLEKISQPNIM